MPALYSDRAGGRAALKPIYPCRPLEWAVTLPASALLASFARISFPAQVQDTRAMATMGRSFVLMLLITVACRGQP